MSTTTAKFWVRDGRGGFHPTDTKPKGKFMVRTGKTTNKKTKKRTDFSWLVQVTEVLTAKQFARLGKKAAK